MIRILLVLIFNLLLLPVNVVLLPIRFAYLLVVDHKAGLWISTSKSRDTEL